MKKKFAICYLMACITLFMFSAVVSAEDFMLGTGNNGPKVSEEFAREVECDTHSVLSRDALPASWDDYRKLSVNQQQALFLGVLASNASYGPSEGFASNTVKFSGDDISKFGKFLGIDLKNLSGGEFVISKDNGKDKQELAEHGFSLRYVLGDKDTGVLLASRGNIGIIALRGTYSLESWAYNDFSGIFRVPMFTKEVADGHAPLGFDSYADKVLLLSDDNGEHSIVREFAKTYGQGDKTLIITGHSLGGSCVNVAMKLLRDRVININNLYLTTFGQPLQVDENLKQYAENTLMLKDYSYLGNDFAKNRYLRVLRCWDFVGAVPPSIPIPGFLDRYFKWRHFGTGFLLENSELNLAVAHSGDNYVKDVVNAAKMADFKKVWDSWHVGAQPAGMFNHNAGSVF